MNIILKRIWRMFGCFVFGTFVWFVIFDILGIIAIFGSQQYHPEIDNWGPVVFFALGTIITAIAIYPTIDIWWVDIESEGEK